MIEALGGAAALIASLDPKLLEIVALSLKVSLSAVFCAALLALPLGAAVAVARFPGRHALIVLLNALMGLPPVVVGLAVYLLLSRAGPLGQFGLLFTPSAMVIAQTILIVPIIAALARPRPARIAVSSEYRMSHNSVSAAETPLTPSERSCS